MSTADDRTSGQQEAESVAGGSGRGPLPVKPAATGSKGSTGEVSSGHRSEDTLSAEPPVSDGADVEPAQAPNGGTTVAVVVGLVKGVYHVQRNKVLYSGSELTPTQFEAVGGKESARKWRNSIRVLLPDGTAGKRLGPWLRDHGFDTRPLPAPKRKRDQQQQLQQAAGVRRNLSGVGVVVGGMVVGGSQPGSPLTRGPLSPSKSAKIESVPASPRCPHCRGGGAACGSMPSAAPSPHQPTHAHAHTHTHAHAHCPTHGPADSAAAIKRSLEAFLAGLPPSAQAALGCVVGAAPAYPPHPDPAATGAAALPTWQNKGASGSQAAGPPASGGGMPARAGSCLSPLSTLRSTFHSLARQGQLLPTHPPAAALAATPVAPGATQLAPRVQPQQQQQQQPAAQAAAGLPHPPPAQPPQQQQKPQQSQQQQGAPGAQPEPQEPLHELGDAAHYLTAPPTSPEERKKKAASRPRQLPPQILQLLQQVAAGRQAQVELSKCTPVIPGWESGGLPSPVPSCLPSPGQALQPPALPHMHMLAPQQQQQQQQSLPGPAQAAGGFAALLQTPGVARAAAQQQQLQRQSPAGAACLPAQPSHQAAANVGSAGAAGAAPACSPAALLPPHQALPQQQGLPEACSGGQGSVPMEEGGDPLGNDLDWLLDGADLDLSALLAQDSPRDGQQSGGQQNEGQPAVTSPDVLAAAAAALTPLLQLGGGGGGGNQGGDRSAGQGDAGGEEEVPSCLEGEPADLLAELLRSVLPSPSDGGSLPWLPSPRQQQQQQQQGGQQSAAAEAELGDSGTSGEHAAAAEVAGAPAAATGPEAAAGVGAVGPAGPRPALPPPLVIPPAMQDGGGCSMSPAELQLQLSPTGQFLQAAAGMDLASAMDVGSLGLEASGLEVVGMDVLEGDELPFTPTAAAAAAAVEEELAQAAAAAAAAAGGAKRLTSSGSAIDLKVFAGMRPPSDPSPPPGSGAAAGPSSGLCLGPP